MKRYDVIYLGSGHAAWHGAMLLKQAGKSVLLVEKDLEGGTCTNYGCDAKILLDGPFELMHQMHRYQGIGKKGEFAIDWSQLMAYKEEVTSPFPDNLEQGFKQAGLDEVKGHGRLKSEHIVEVDGQEYYGEFIVLATGARAKRLEIPGAKYAHDSRHFLSLKNLPERFVLIGAGIISMEFASMLTLLGKEVHVVEFSDRALAAYKEDYVATVVAEMEKQGVVFHFGQAVQEISAENDSYLVKTASGLVLEADYVLDATGRVANVEDLGLEALGIEASSRGVVVNEYLQTKYPHIYASGDVIDKSIPKLTPTAIYESNYIARHILGEEAALTYPPVPHLVYTLPRIASVGVTSKEAKTREDLTIHPFAYGAINLFETKNEATAHITFIVDDKKHLVGAEIMGDDADSIVNFLVLVINQQLDVARLNQMIFAFPGISSAIIGGLKQALS